MDRKQVQAQQAEYNAEVAAAAVNLIASLDVDDDTELDEQMMHQIDEIENSHPWVLDDEKAIIVLQYSNNPTAEFFHHGTPLKSDETKYGKAAFPFSTCAAAAFAEDVKDHLRSEYGFDGPLTKKQVKKAQKQAR